MANQIVVSAGAKVRNLSGVLTGTSGVVSSVPLGAANGVATLDSGGKVPVSQLPSSVVTYLGTWNANTNTPTLVNGTGDAGDMYICNVAGTVNFGAGPVTFAVGDWVLYGSGTWQKSSGQNGTVTSVAITESGDSLNITGSPITTSGTINIGFNGTNLQYVNGAGNLTTFPTLTGYVPYTGATANVDLGVYDLTADLITGARGSFTSNGGSDTFAINHSSGGGIALNITKGGAGEGLYINKTSGSGNAATIIGTLEATTLVKSGGTSSQFLKADGTVDSNTYALDSAVVKLAGTQTITGAKTFSAYTTFTSTVDITSGLTFSNSGFTLVLQPPTLSVNRTVTLPNGTGTLALTSDISYPVTSVFGRTGAVVATSGDYTTAQVTESGNLYFTDSRARLALSFVAGSGAYNSTTGVITIPTNNNQITNGSNYITLGSLSAGVGISYNNTTGVITNSAPDQTVSLTAGSGISVSGTYPSFTIASTITQYTDALARAAISLTTTGTSGASTYNSTTGVFNIPNYTTDLSNYVDLTTAQTIGGTKTFSNATKNDGGIFLQNGSSNALAGYMNLGGLTNGLKFTSGGGISNTFTLPSATGYTFTFPSATGTIALTSDVPSLSGTAPISYSAGVISISQATTSTNGYLSSTDWNTFNLKQAQLNGTGFVKATGTTISYDNTNYLPLTGGILTGALAGTSGTFIQVGIGASPVNYFSVRTGTNNIFDIYDNGTGPAIQSVNDGVTLYRPLFFFATAFTFSNSVTATSFVKTSGTSSQFLKADGSVDSSTYALDSAVVHNTGNETVGGTKTFSDATKNNGGIFLQNASSNSLAGYMNIGGLTNGVKFTSGGGISNSFTLPSATGYTYTFPSATGTIALTSDIPSLTGYVNTSGTPTTNYLPKFTGTSTIGNSNLINDGSGNLGLGVTPNTWTLGKAIQIGALNGLNLFGGSGVAQIGNNVYYNGGYFYGANGTATIYTFDGGGHVWSVAPSGAANAAITFTQAMTLLANGNLLLGTTSAQSGTRLQVAGVMDVWSSTNTLLRLNHDGSRGTIETFTGGAYGPTSINANGGNVLIGTTTDAGYKLDVNGTGRFSNTLEITLPSGVNGQIIRMNRSAGAYGWGIGIDASASNFNFYNNGGTSVANISPTGAATFSSSVDATVFNSTRTSNYLLRENSGSGYGIFKNSTTEIGIAVNGTVALNFLSTGEATFTSSVTATSFFESSDSRLKTLIQDNYQTKGIASITPKLYTKNGKVELGYYAQDFVGVLDSAVSKGSDDMLSLSYREVHTAKIYALEQRIKELESKMN